MCVSVSSLAGVCEQGVNGNANDALTGLECHINELQEPQCITASGEEVAVLC